MTGDTQVRALAQRIAALEDAVSKRGEQLAYSALEDGAIREFDLVGTQVAQYGTQWDGTHTAASLVGPTPPRPSAPLVAGVPGGLLIGWDGFFDESTLTVAPMDFTRVDVAVGPVGFNPIATPPTTAFVSPRGGSVFVSLPVGDHEVALITRTESGAASTSSVIITGTAQALTGTSEDATARALAQQAIDDAAAAAALANQAQTTADAAATIYRQATAPASGMVVNDMWIDSDDGLLYIWTGSAWVLSADQRVADLVTSNASKITAFAQPSAPTTTGRVEGDIWVDTDDGNKVYVWTWGGSGWTPRTFGAAAISATARQLGAVTIYRQSTAPASGMITNDMWVDSDDGLLYIYTGTWTLSADQRVATLVTSNATKITLFNQASPPSTSGRTTGDIWIDWDDNNLIYIWDGGWQPKRDGTIAIADAKAVQAAADAAAAVSAASAAQGTANTALTAANGKNQITHADFAPTTEANTAGDTWFLHAPLAEGGAIIGQYTGLGGASWSATTISHQVISSVDLGVATVGKLAANYIESGTLSAALTVTGYLLAGNPAGARVVIDDNGIRQYDAAGNLLTNIPTDPLLPSLFEGAVVADSITIKDYMSLQGLQNKVARGAVLTMEGSTGAPGAAPSVAVGYPVFNQTRWTYLFIPAGLHCNTDDNSADIIGAMTFLGYGTIIGKGNGAWSGPEYTDSSGGKRNKYGNIGAATAVYVGGQERVVINSAYMTANGQTPVGRISSLDVSGLLSNGSVEPVLKAQLNAKLDDYLFYFRLGRVFSGIGSSTLNDRIAMGMFNWNSNVGEAGKVTLRQYVVTDNPTLNAGFSLVAGSEKVVAPPWATGEEMIGVTHGRADKLGFPATTGAAVTDYLWLVHGSKKTYVWNATAGMTRITDYDFDTPPGAARMHAFGDLATNQFLGWRTTEFSDTSPVTKMTNNHWVGATSSKWWVSSTNHDADITGGTHESTQGPRASLTMKKRAGLVVTVPPFPVRPSPTTTDDPLSARIYIGRGAADPTRTYMERAGQVDSPNRTLVVGTFAFPAGTATAPPPVAGDFPASSAARLMSGGAGWVLSGDGKASLAGVDFDAALPGLLSTAMRTLDFRWTDATTTNYGSTTPLTMGARGGQGTFVAPPSGVVAVHFGGTAKSGADGQYASIGFEIREGSTVGSGTVVKAFNLNESWLHYSIQYTTGTTFVTVSGLTPGATYNIRNLIASGTATAGTFIRGRILVAPLP